MKPYAVGLILLAISLLFLPDQNQGEDAKRQEILHRYASQVLAVREREYVEAARALGYSHSRILFRHILPNIMGPVWVVSASNFASAIVIEAGEAL